MSKPNIEHIFNLIGNKLFKMFLEELGNEYFSKYENEQFNTEGILKLYTTILAGVTVNGLKNAITITRVDKLTVTRTFLELVIDVMALPLQIETTIED